MNKKFKYSVLKYRPNYLLDERVNVGLLFVFLDEKKVEFIFPKQLSRLSDLYPQLDLYQTRKYLNQFKNKASKINLPLFIDSPTILEDEFIIKDSNSFFFEEFKVGFHSSFEDTLKYYHKQYFEVYHKENLKRFDDNYLSRQFAKSLRERVPKKQSEKLQLFRPNVKLANKVDTTEFDFAWQNGSTNLIKSLGFDLSSKEYIQRKSSRWYGELSLLNKETCDKNLRFDLIVSPPQKKEFNNAFEDAISVLESLDAHHKIIQLSEIDQYVDSALKSVKQLSFDFSS